MQNSAYLIFLTNNIFYIFLTQIKNKWNLINKRVHSLIDMPKKDFVFLSNTKGWKWLHMTGDF